jgi:hypothetical protein
LSDPKGSLILRPAEAEVLEREKISQRRRNRVFSLPKQNLKRAFGERIILRLAEARRFLR